LAPADRFFASQTTQVSVNLVVLPVFFHRADAACLTRRNWETAVELNPQLGRSLRVLEVSPRLIPGGVGFRRDCNPAGRQVLLDSFLNVPNTKGGTQILSLFEVSRFTVRPFSVLQATLEMVRKFKRLQT